MGAGAATAKVAPGPAHPDGPITPKGNRYAVVVSPMSGSASSEKRRGVPLDAVIAEIRAAAERLPAAQRGMALLEAASQLGLSMHGEMRSWESLRKSRMRCVCAQRACV